MMGDAVAERIDSYEPDIPDDEWNPIAEFVREAVRDCDARTPYAARDLLVVSARHVRWCRRTAGLPLDRSVVFHRDVIAEYIDTGCGQMSMASKGNRRSQLLRMSEILLPPQERTSRLPALPPSDPLEPYDDGEIVALLSWANGLNTRYRRVQAHLLLSLGLGAGLSAAEILRVEARHILVDDYGVLVVVTGSRPRVVPVLAAWETPLLDYARARPLNPQQYVFRAKRTTLSPYSISQFVERTRPGRVRATVQRMRVTWIVTHLAAGTPVKALVAAAGVDSLEALTRYLRFVPDADPKATRAALRAALGGDASA